MKCTQGQNRAQTYFFHVSFEETIDQDNEVRLIDAFVSSLILGVYGFKITFVENASPACHTSDLLKLYICGYMNKVGSYRDPEKKFNEAY